MLVLERRNIIKSSNYTNSFPQSVIAFDIVTIAYEVPSVAVAWYLEAGMWVRVDKGLNPW